MITVVILVLIVATGYFFVTSYNSLQRKASQVQKCNANILTALLKYSDTINKLQELLTGYVGHEKLLFFKASDNIVEMTKATANALANIHGLAQTYPDIKANQTYQQLMGQVSFIQEQITNYRVSYNGAVANYNSQIKSIPEVFFASALGFKEASFYNPDKLQEVNEFKTDDGTLVKEMLKKGTNSTVATLKNAKENIAHKIEEVKAKNENENAKKCSQCGCVVTEGDAFCPNCGNKIEQASEAERGDA